MSCLGHVLNRTRFWDDFHDDVCLRSIQRQGSRCAAQGTRAKWKEIQCLQSVFRSGSARLPPPSQSLLCSLVVWPPRRPPPALAAGSTTAPGAESEPSVFASRLRQECESQPEFLGENACVRQVKKFEIFLNGRPGCLTFPGGELPMRERQLAKTVRIFPRDPYGTLPLGHARGSLRTAGVTLLLPRSIT